MPVEVVDALCLAVPKLVGTKNISLLLAFWRIIRLCQLRFAFRISFAHFITSSHIRQSQTRHLDEAYSVRKPNDIRNTLSDSPPVNGLVLSPVQLHQLQARHVCVGRVCLKPANIDQFWKAGVLRRWRFVLSSWWRFRGTVRLFIYTHITTVNDAVASLHYSKAWNGGIISEY